MDGLLGQPGLPSLVERSLPGLHGKNGGTDAEEKRDNLNMKNVLKVIGGFALWLVLFAGGLVLAIFFIKGGVWLSEKLLPILSVISALSFLACILVLVPLAVFRRTQGFAGIGLYVASYIFGASLWMTGLLLSYTLWGLLAVFIGLFLLGVGVVPVALLATLINGLWSAFFGLVFLLVATYGSRSMAIYVLTKYDEGSAPSSVV
jgi:hypothetical protein